MFRLDLTDCGITNLDQAKTIPLKLKEMNLAKNPIMNQRAPGENLVYLINIAPVLTTSLGASPCLPIFNWSEGNVPHSVLEYDKPLPLALWPKVLNRAYTAFQPFPLGFTSEPDAIYRPTMSFTIITPSSRRPFSNHLLLGTIDWQKVIKNEQP